MSEVPLSHTYEDAAAMAKYYEQEFAFSLVREGEFREKAEDQARVISALTKENRHLREEMDRYYQESRASAAVVGGILRVLRDNNVGWKLKEERNDEQE